MTEVVQPPGSGVPVSIIAVPDDAVGELVSARLVSTVPTPRRAGRRAAVTIGTGSTTLVTLTQAPATVYLLGTWAVARARRLSETVRITGNRPSNSVRFEVHGDEPPELVANYLASALNG